MVFRRFLKSSSLTSLFSEELVENENLSGFFAFIRRNDL
ncbi:hypothetical protein T4B_10214 [Trichinella pseudospiralis]|uniref:Uncharacterized protein n=1 Tax=Trichinella pseudospiralis TaxID=6337 RepID=A0A0V1GP05_TRIPS|nr:hypothetical protein T4B_10214 [Trichinella pseudospiralis]KRZ04384.1 hypothetical protein T4C_7494 [Trichinella pseudospiralis]